MIDRNLSEITPTGYSSVCPYLMVENVLDEMLFILSVFDGLEVGRMAREEEVFHGEVSIGEVVIMIGKSRREWPVRPGTNYVFVKDVEKVYDRALKNGGKEILAPEKRSYGLIEGGFSDPQDNQWWVAQRSGP